MNREPQEPKQTQHDDLHGDVYSHPAFGQIGASRVTGQTTLYGSDFEHHAYVIVRIWKSDLHRNLSRDWHMAGKELIEVAMSEAQWASFVSSMNVGHGVPCTIERIAGEGATPPIPHRQERDVVSQEVVEHAREMAVKVTKAIAAIEGEVGASMSNKRREAILGHLRSLEQDLRSNVAFHVDSFEKHIENTVEKAKIEVGAYVQATIQRAGLEALGATPPIQLLTGETESVLDHDCEGDPDCQFCKGEETDGRDV